MAYNQGVADSNKRRVKHGGAVNSRQNGAESTYHIWRGIKQRCLNPDSKAYHRYGGRGITMNEEWANSYVVFRDYVGEKPNGMTLDRIDNSKGYEPDNVKWASRKEQANNRVTNVVITYNGLTMTLKQWAEHLGWKYGLIASRWKNGLKGDDLFSPPKNSRGNKYTYKGKTMTLTEWAKESQVPYTTLKWRVNNNKDLL